MKKIMVLVGFFLGAISLANASPRTDALNILLHDQQLHREISLGGLSQDKLVLAGQDGRELFFPVPPNIPLLNAQLQLKGNYYDSGIGSSRLISYVNNEPIYALSYSNQSQAVDSIVDLGTHTARSGFMRVQFNWQALDTTQKNHCVPPLQTGSAFSVLPQTALRYQLNVEDVKTLMQVWQLLPTSTTVTLGTAQLNDKEFDNAWRMALLLGQANKKPRMTIMPTVGDQVLLPKQLHVPTELSSLSAFSFLTQSQSQPVVNLETPAQVAALALAWPQGVFGDVLIWDHSVQKNIQQAFSALAEELTQADAQLGAMFTQWKSVQPWLKADFMQEASVRFMKGPGSVTLVVSADDDKKALDLLDVDWGERFGAASYLTIHQLKEQSKDTSSQMPLYKDADGKYNLHVVDRGSWIRQILLRDLNKNSSHIPERLVLDVAAAPGASTTKPVASVYWNDVLLEAKQLRADGKPERISARIPAYAMGLTNKIEVQFQRQPVSVECNEAPQGYPVTVLPTSYIQLTEAIPKKSFDGIAPLLKGGADLIIPRSFLDQSAESIARIVEAGIASGLNINETQLRIVEADQSYEPSNHFLAMDVALANSSPRVMKTGEGQIKIKNQEVDWLSVEGLDYLTAVEALTAGDNYGLLWQQLGKKTQLATQPYLLAHGDLAIVSAQGPKVWFGDPKQPRFYELGSNKVVDADEWRQYVAWATPFVAALLFIFLLFLILARMARMRSKKKEG